MTRKLKALGLSFVAIFAMSAVAASAAQAEGTFMAETYPVAVHGVNTNAHTFTTPSGVTISCSEAEFNGTASAASSELTITPTYKSCSTKVLGVTFPVTVTIGTTGHLCDYRFHAGTQTSADHYSGTADIECNTAGESITVDVYASEAKHLADEPFCQLHIAEQTGLGSVKYVNNTSASPKNVTVEAAVEHIKYTRTGSILCGSASSEATYEGNALVSGTHEGAGDGLTVEP